MSIHCTVDGNPPPPPMTVRSMQVRFKGALHDALKVEGR